MAFSPIGYPGTSKTATPPPIALAVTLTVKFPEASVVVKFPYFGAPWPPLTGSYTYPITLPTVTGFPSSSVTWPRSTTSSRAGAVEFMTKSRVNVSPELSETLAFTAQ